MVEALPTLALSGQQPTLSGTPVLTVLPQQIMIIFFHQQMEFHGVGITGLAPRH